MSLLDRIIRSADGAAAETRRRAELAAHGDRRSGIGGAVTSGLIGAVAGAATSFLLDPARGRARRARLRDQGAATVRLAARRAGQVANRVRADLQGRASAMRASRMADARPIDDATLGDRIQSTVFRDPALPKGDINMNVERGVVVLRGEVPDQAMRERLVAEIEAVEGVWTVRDMLHLPGEEATSVRVG